MRLSEISYDGGQTKNLAIDDEYDKDFIDIRGDDWKTYRKNWLEYCHLKKEENFVPHLEIELNYSWNLKCPMCTWAMENEQQLRKDWFSFEDYKRLLKEAVENGTKSLTLTYINEPLIREDISQFIRYAADIGVIDILITTNGTLLTKEVSKKLIDSGLTKINISLDAVTEETYNKIRVGGDFKKTIKNIFDFLKVREDMCKKIPKLGVNFARTKLNDHEYQDFIKFWKDKADLIVVQNMINPFAEGKFYNPSKNNVFKKSEKPIPKKFHCPEPFKRMTVRPNGDVLPCCSFYAVDIPVGNWKNNTLTEIWNSEKMKNIRRTHKKGDYYSIKACKLCIENTGYLID